MDIDSKYENAENTHANAAHTNTHTKMPQTSIRVSFTFKGNLEDITGIASKLHPTTKDTPKPTKSPDIYGCVVTYTTDTFENLALDLSLLRSLKCRTFLNNIEKHAHQTPIHTVFVYNLCKQPTLKVAHEYACEIDQLIHKAGVKEAYTVVNPRKTFGMIITNQAGMQKILQGGSINTPSRTIYFKPNTPQQKNKPTREPEQKTTVTQQLNEIKSNIEQLGSKVDTMFNIVTQLQNSQPKSTQLEEVTRQTAHITNNLSQIAKISGDIPALITELKKVHSEIKEWQDFTDYLSFSVDAPRRKKSAKTTIPPPPPVGMVPIPIMPALSMSPPPPFQVAQGKEYDNIMQNLSKVPRPPTLAPACPQLPLTSIAATTPTLSVSLLPATNANPSTSITPRPILPATQSNPQAKK